MPLVKRKGSQYYQLHIGRKIRVSTGTADYEEAKEFERAERERLWRYEKLGDRGVISFTEAALRWLAATSSEKRRDREILDWLAPQIGSDTVRAVADSARFEEIRAKGLEDGWSHATIDRAMGTLSAVLRDCFKRGEIEAVPAIPMYRPPPDEPRFLMPHELDRLCAELWMHQALAAKFAVASLLRMRAMGQLEWSRIDFANRRAWVPRSQQKGKKNTFSFHLTDEMVGLLRALRWLSPPDCRYVFTWQGKRIDDFNTLSFQEAVKRAGLEPLRWHDLRHTGASWAVQSGVTLPELMILGDWKDYRSVLRYAHFAPSSAASAATKVAQWAHTQRIAAEARTERKRARTAA